MDDSALSSPLETMLSHHISNHNGAHPPQLPLLLPLARKQLTRKRRVTTIDMLYRSVDTLHRDYDSALINHVTALSLSLATVLYRIPNSTYRVPTKIKSMMVSDVFQMHPTWYFLHWKDTADTGLLSWKQAPRQLFRGIKSGNIRLQPFFQPLCTPNTALSTTSNLISLQLFIQKLLPLDATNGMSIQSPSKTCRQVCTSLVVASPHLRAINSPAWIFFWSLSLTMIQRNVIYRFINKCIPHLSLLHRIFPDQHTTDTCVVCSSASDTQDHFLFRCPPKILVWQGTIFEFLWPTVTIDDICHSILSFNFYNIRYSQQPLVPSHLIVMITMANIWRAHYGLLFNQKTFETTAVLNNIRLDINKMIDEDQVHNMIQFLCVYLPSFFFL